MKDKLIKLLIRTLNQDQKYKVAVEADLTAQEALDLLEFDCQQYGVPLREEEEAEEVKEDASTEV